MATEALFDSVEVEAMGSTNMSIISVIGSRGAAAAVGGFAAAAGHII
ncbi:MAG: hypothetical protein P4L98_22695 [Ancalomicrobiaceae bacterium]|nr:hypothetical protein [Ancalomicrobiaceae bacterium]